MARLENAAHQEGARRGESSPTFAERYLDWIARLAVAPAAFLLYSWVFVFTGYVVSRQVFKSGWLFVEEYTVFWLVVVGYLAILYAFVTGRHVVVEFVVVHLPRRLKAKVEIVTNLIALASIGYMTWRGFELFSREFARKTVTTSGLQTPFWPFHLLMAVGLALLTIAIAADTWLRMTGRAYQPDLSQESSEEEAMLSERRPPN